LGRRAKKKKNLVVLKVIRRL